MVGVDYDTQQIAVVLYILQARKAYPARNLNLYSNVSYLMTYVVGRRYYDVLLRAGSVRAPTLQLFQNQSQTLEFVAEIIYANLRRILKKAARNCGTFYSVAVVPYFGLQSYQIRDTRIYVSKIQCQSMGVPGRRADLRQWLSSVQERDCTGPLKKSLGPLQVMRLT